MHEGGKLGVGLHLVVVGIVSYLLCVHDWSRYLDDAAEVHVVVAQVIGRRLNLLLG